MNFQATSTLTPTGSDYAKHNRALPQPNGRGSMIIPPPAWRPIDRRRSVAV